jgi:choline dehydrogenase
MSSINNLWQNPQTTPLDFIVIGGGAGGGPLAARLAERGYQVLVLEMGPVKPPTPPDATVENTEVPLLHPETTEDPRHSLRYFVKHHDHDPENSLDPKVHQSEQEDERGIFYPRAQGIGGCTIHHAMITICGPPKDWDEIAELTGDPSWRGESMRAYFERIERCHYDQPRSWWGKFKATLGFDGGWRDGRHGHSGWLNTTMASTRFLKREKQFFQSVLSAAAQSADSSTDQIAEWIRPALKGRAFPGLDPNHWKTIRHSQEGLTQIPTAIGLDGRRSGVRERVLNAAKEHPDRLHIVGDAMVSRLLFDRAGETPRAIGVEVVLKAHAYQADPNHSEIPTDSFSQPQAIYCNREVILSGGTFNSPQLLMLSGIGSRDHLQSHQIDVIQDLPGVGCHLQDRYEVPVIATLTDRFRTLDELSLTSFGDAAKNDSALQAWKRGDQPIEDNFYATNGGVIGLFKRSQKEDHTPDLFMFAIAGRFPGYQVGWSKPSALAPAIGSPRVSEKAPMDAASKHKRSLTWVVLKARTHHQEGYVRLRDTNPSRRPEINFRSFPGLQDDALGGTDADLEAIVEGVQTVQEILQHGKERGVIESFELPGLSGFDGDVRRWIRHTAWGHHAAGTCKMGSHDETDAVVDSRLKVRGVQGLRIVDASVFPKIPGYFIVTNIYMLSEKAADILTEDHPLPSKLAADPNAPLLASSTAHARRRAYPIEFEREEAELIHRRRQVAGLDPSIPSNDGAQT